jgi:hypothetical protein
VIGGSESIQTPSSQSRTLTPSKRQVFDFFRGWKPATSFRPSLHIFKIFRSYTALVGDSVATIATNLWSQRFHAFLHQPLSTLAPNQASNLTLTN